VEIDGGEPINEIEVTHRDEPIGDFAFTSTFNQLFHNQMVEQRINSEV